MNDPSARDDEDRVRVDQWAWAVRLFKTRALAAAACKNGRLLVNGQRCRASRRLAVGDEIHLRQGSLVRTLQVKTSLRHRVGAKEVAKYCLDLTPPEEYARVEEMERAARNAVPRREAGAGRPTKRDRRVLEEWVEPREELSFEAFADAFLRRPRQGNS